MEFNVKNIKVGLFGDVIIDKYKYFNAIKLSPEGPAPVVKKISDSLSIGGAGNVAISMSNLGLDVELNYAQSSQENLSKVDFIDSIAIQNNIKLKKFISNFSKSIPIKIRYYVDGKQFMREDLEEEKFFDEKLISIEYIESAIKKYNLFVISDYQKGFLSSDIIKNIIFNCNQNNIPLFIDTKNVEIEYLKNAFCLKINQKEFNILFDKYKFNLNENIKEINKKVDLARISANITNLILTIGSKGAILSNSSKTINVKPEAVDVVDITGAGDAFLSAMTYSFSQINNLEEIDLKKNFININDVKFANKASASVISLKGTAPISREFLKCYLRKISEKKKIGFTNGCFDLLHLGHLSLLKQSKDKCDYLIVGLNSDSSIKNLKGDKRPINDQETRYEILKALEYVDEVRIFEDETPLNLIKEISPDVLIKGSDYLESEIIGADYVKSYGGDIFRVKILDDKSTTNIINKINK